MKTTSFAAAITVVGAGVAAYERWGKPWQQRWGATDADVIRALPGDELVEEPATQMTRAVTIEATRAEVWPWIVQLGADRGGFYTYDWLENLIGLDIHSADDIEEEWQELAVGDMVYADRARTGGWYVMDLLPNEALVLKVGEPGVGRPFRRDERLKWEFLWTFALLDAPSGGTRLLVRERLAFDSVVTGTLMAPVGLVSFAMTRGMLLGIKARVESSRTDRVGADRRAPLPPATRTGAGGR